MTKQTVTMKKDTEEYRNDLHTNTKELTKFRY